MQLAPHWCVGVAYYLILFCPNRHRLEGLGIPRAGLAAFAVDSLSFAFKIWGPDNNCQADKKRHGPIPSKVPPFQNDQKVDRVKDKEENLSLPSFGELPADWLAKFKHDQAHPSTPQAHINPLFAIHFSNTQNFE